jgi:hypothetical protein
MSHRETRRAQRWSAEHRLTEMKEISTLIRHAKGSMPGQASQKGLLLGLVTIAVLALFLPASAAAEPATPTYAYTGSFGSSGSGSGEFTVPSDLAVEPGTGNILVADTGNNRVEVFAPDGSVIGTYLTTIDTGAGSAPVGIAIDQSTGAIYVSESGDNEITRFVSDGAPTPTYTKDASFTSPAQGSAAGEVGSFAAALAVDPVNHDLLVADPGNNRVSRYTASGTFVSSFDGSDSAGGAFTGLVDVAAGTDGTTYVVDANGEYNLGGGASRTERFDQSGVSLGPIVIDTNRFETYPSAVAVDPASGRVVVVAHETALYLGAVFPRLYVFQPTGTEPIASTDFPPQATNGIVMGVAIDGGGAHRLYSSEQRYFGELGEDTVFGFDPSVIPGVSLSAPTDVTTVSAHLDGTVDPGGSATSAYFEYSADEGASWTSTDPQEVGEGSGEQSISADLTALAPNTAYLVRLHASNAFGNAKTSDSQSFNTLIAPPAVITDGAGDITATSATLYGRINPFGLLTTYHFEYGTSDQYGSRTPATEAPAGNGRVERSFSQPLTGLQPGVTYHYRLVATSSAGTATGLDQTFTSVAGEEIQRRYEQVSPVDKSGNFVDFNRTLPQASPDGSAVTYGTSGAFENDSPAGPIIPRYLAARSPEGWSSKSLDAPQLSPVPTLPNPGLGRTVLAVSEDLSHSVVISNKALTPGAIDDGSNLYLLDNTTRSYTLIGASANQDLYIGRAYIAAEVGRFTVGASPDFSTFAFVSSVALTPDGPEGVQSVYLWSGGSLSLASKDDSGQPLGYSRGPEISPVHVLSGVSEDGASLYFTVNPGQAAAGVYLRRDGTHTSPISVSHRAGDDPQVVVPGRFFAASRDGRYAFFETGINGGEAAPPLTEDAEEGPGNVYRYDQVTDTLQLVGSRIQDVLAVSTDGSYAYLFTQPVAAEASAQHLQVWHQGDGITDIATTTEASGIGGLLTWEGSPSGRYFSFRRNSGDVSLLLYDAQTDTLACASCSKDGTSSGEAVHDPADPLYTTNHWPRRVTDEGVLFFSTAASLVASDVNGVQDVYEYRDGQPHLISPGKGTSPSYFVEASSSGRDVFFTTESRLVPQDNDDLADLYDARVGGGIVAQQVGGERPGCSGPACQAAGVTPPPLLGGSEAISGTNRSDQKKRCGKGRHRVVSKGKARCVRKHAHKHRRHGGNRRQGR